MDRLTSFCLFSAVWLQFGQNPIVISVEKKYFDFAQIVALKNISVKEIVILLLIFLGNYLLAYEGKNWDFGSFPIILIYYLLYVVSSNCDVRTYMQGRIT